jgi:hypothetical protein
MKPTRRAALGTGTSLLALLIASSPGLAFDTVDWRWNSAINETVRKTVNIDINIAPAGMIFLENHQVQIGDVTAVSRVVGVHNNKPGTTVTETEIQTIRSFEFVDIDFDALLQIGAGNNAGANPPGSAQYGTPGLFTDPALPGAQSHLALYTLSNHPDSIDHERSFLNEATKTFEIYAYFDDLDLFLDVKGSYAGCTPGGANCTPTGTVELFRMDGDEKVFVALSVLEQQNGVDQVNTAGPGGHVKLSADFDGARELREILTQIITQREIVVPVVSDATTELPTVISAATAVANNSNIATDVAVQLHARQLAWGGFVGETSGQDPLDFGSLLLNASILQGEVSALSEVADILNASVESTATAVVNNKAVLVAAPVADNRLLIADVLQFSNNRVDARSTVSAVELQSYVNLGLINRPIVASIATAVGNNLAISVQSLPPVLR